jgi:serine/threonine protein kinase
VIDPALSIGERYEVGPVIGLGGMSEVRSGRDLRLDRPVAIKVLRRELSDRPDVRQRFESEARLAARLSHPNVVAVYDSGETAGVPYIIMERLPGPTLYDRFAQGPMATAEARDLAAQVLAALAAAHAAGVLHRDIKPGNILCGAEPGVWKVGDFGIAKALEVGSADHTATGLLMGTPAYLAPERFLGDPATVAADLYALAVVLYEALTGRKPFQSERIDGWVPVIEGTRPPPVRSLRPDADEALAAAIERSLARDPDRRFASAAEMAAAITAPAVATAVVAESDDPAAGPYGPPVGAATRIIRQPPAAPTSVLPRSARVRALVRHRRLPARMWVLGATIVVLILLAALAVTGHGGGSHAPASGSPTTATTVAAPAAGGGAGGGTGTSAGSGAGAGQSGSLPPGLARALDGLQKQVKR